VSSVGIDNQRAGGGPAAGAEGCYGDTVTIEGGQRLGYARRPHSRHRLLFATFVDPGSIPDGYPVVEAGMFVACKTLMSRANPELVVMRRLRSEHPAADDTSG